MGADGKSAGHAEVITTPVITADGVRSQRPAGEPDSTLQILSPSRDDLEALSKIPAFPLLDFGNSPTIRLLTRADSPWTNSGDVCVRRGAQATQPRARLFQRPRMGGRSRPGHRQDLWQVGYRNGRRNPRAAVAYHVRDLSPARCKTSIGCLPIRGRIAPSAGRVPMLRSASSFAGTTTRQYHRATPRRHQPRPSRLQICPVSDMPQFWPPQG